MYNLERYGTRFDWIGRNRKSQTPRYLLEYRIRILRLPIIGLIHICLYQSVLLEEMKIPIFHCICKETKRNKKDHFFGMKFCDLSPFHRKGKNELIYFFFSGLMDFDSSGLTGLEPAASALTGRCSDQLNYNPLEIKLEIK